MMKTPGSTAGFFISNPWEYINDLNGNMIVDHNKDITISYSHLNLPDTVTKGTGEYIVYTYDATGRKLTQRVFNAAILYKSKPITPAS